MDLSNVTFIGLITVGVVNVLSFWKPNIDSRIKFAVAAGVAFGLTFVPAEISNIILDKAVQALEVAFASSGAYKLAIKAGGK